MYGIDAADDVLMASRTWIWLRQRVLSLLDRPPTFLPFKAGDQWRLTQVPSTRLGYLLTPPDFGD